MGMGILWESHGNGNKTQKWEWEWEGMGNQVNGKGNYLHCHGNVFPWEYIAYSRTHLQYASSYCAEINDDDYLKEHITITSVLKMA